MQALTVLSAEVDMGGKFCQVAMTAVDVAGELLQLSLQAGRSLFPDAAGQLTAHDLFGAADAACGSLHRSLQEQLAQAEGSQQYTTDGTSGGQYTSEDQSGVGVAAQATLALVLPTCLHHCEVSMMECSFQAARQYFPGSIDSQRSMVLQGKSS